MPGLIHALSEIYLGLKSFPRFLRLTPRASAQDVSLAYKGAVVSRIAVAIIGAGPYGLSLSAHLAAQKRRSTVSSVVRCSSGLTSPRPAASAT